MERIFAFTDEYGAFGWKFEKPDVSTHFIITAIIIKESDLCAMHAAFESIRKKYFQTGEMKSSKIGKNHNRRINIIKELLPLPFAIFPVIIDKKACLKMKGLQYKKSFYKFMNNIVHKELRNAFKKLTIIADEIGNNDYMKSFVEYVQKHEEIPSLFDETNFLFKNSKNDLLIQLADFISGTLSYVYDDNKRIVSHPDYIRILNKKIIRVMIYPKTYDTYKLETSAMSRDYDKEIAEICFNQAVSFITKYHKDIDENIRAQIIVLDYLLFRFMNNDTRGYIPTKELKSQLQYTIHENISNSSFRLKIICKLRDAGVIIASSSQGYKIPSKEAELYDFINHGVSIVIPLMSRLEKCRNLIKMSTTNNIDLFNHSEYHLLKAYFDNSK